MRWLLSFLLLGLLSVVQAASSSGNKLLIVLEELAEKSKYSKYIADLEGMRIALRIWRPIYYMLRTELIFNIRQRIFYIN
jgi:oligosaccharyltransferase complex subunit beta